MTRENDQKSHSSVRKKWLCLVLKNGFSSVLKNGFSSVRKQRTGSPNHNTSLVWFSRTVSMIQSVWFSSLTKP